MPYLALIFPLQASTKDLIDPEIVYCAYKLLRLLESRY